MVGSELFRHCWQYLNAEVDSGFPITEQMMGLILQGSLEQIQFVPKNENYASSLPHLYHPVTSETWEVGNNKFITLLKVLMEDPTIIPSERKPI